MVFAGTATIDRNSFRYGSPTTILTPYTVSDNGTLTTWQCYMYAAGNIKIKIFRSNGSNWDFIGESSIQSASIGLNTFSCSIAVLSGDYLGFYIDSSAAIDVTSSGSVQSYSQAADITTNTPKTNWTTDAITGDYSIFASSGELSDIYVALTGNDSNSGGTLASSKLTLYGGINGLITAGNLHIGFGDFSAQTSFQINKTMNWVFDTSGGVGTTIFPSTI